MNEHELAERLDVALQSMQVAPGDLADVRRRARQRTMRRRAAQWSGGVAMIAVVGLGLTALYTPAGLPIIGEEPSDAPTDATPSAAETAAAADEWWCPTTTFDLFVSGGPEAFFWTEDGPPILAAAYIDTVGNLRTWQQRPVESDDPNLPPASGGSQSLLDGVDDHQAVFVCVFHGTFTGPGGGGDPDYTLATVTAFPDGTAAPNQLIPASKADAFEGAPPTAQPLRQPVRPPLLECDAGVAGTADQATAQSVQDWLAVNRDAQTPHVVSAGLREDLGRVEINVEPDLTGPELDAVAQAFDPRTICITSAARAVPIVTAILTGSNNDILLVMANTCNATLTSELSEGDEVRITVFASGGTVDDCGDGLNIQLARPLDGRTVIDESTGREVSVRVE